MGGDRRSFLAACGSGLLCHGPEGFAERRFSAVLGTPVRAEAEASILRGAPTCRTRITL